MTDNLAHRLCRSVPALALAGLLVIGAAACGGDGGSSDEGSNGGTPADTITIKDFSYSPDPLRANVGDTITVKNEDGSAHTLTADDNSVTTGDLEGGESGSVTVEKAGTLAYHCEIHGNSMKGSIQVSA
jgi:plastocyanin